jgi:hypothetical protein
MSYDRVYRPLQVTDKQKSSDDHSDNSGDKSVNNHSDNGGDNHSGDTNYRLISQFNYTYNGPVRTLL